MRKQANGGRKIKLTMAAMIAIVFAAVASIAIPTMTQAADATSNEQMSVPKLKRVQTIDLNRIVPNAQVQKLLFSPDRRYLAIVLWPSSVTSKTKTDIVVWDMEKRKPQSHIRNLNADYYITEGCYTVSDENTLFWSPNGKVISFGLKQQWNSMSGVALPDKPVIGRAARYNKDGSKMLTIVEGVAFQPDYTYAYDTSTWQVQKLDVDGLKIDSAGWASEGNILFGAYVYEAKGVLGKTLNGYTISHEQDMAIRLLDPSGREATRGVWFPPILLDQNL